jgi:hypothetical protein
VADFFDLTEEEKQGEKKRSPEKVGEDWATVESLARAFSPQRQLQI